MFILDHLKKSANSPVARDLYQKLSLEISKRETIFTDMVKYLSSRPAECNFNLELEIEKLCDRLFDSNSEPSEPVSAVPTSSSACLPTLESELDSFVDSSNDEVLNSSMVVRSELQLFNSTGQRGKYLEMAYQALLTIKPSTVDA